jgi:chromosome segregation ATPase
MTIISIINNIINNCQERPRGGILVMFPFLSRWKQARQDEVALMEKTASRYPVTIRGKGRLYSLVIRCILPASLLCICGSTVWGGKLPVKRPPPTTSMPLDEVMSHLALFQFRIDSLNAVRTKLRQDSAAAVADLSQQWQALSKKQTETDNAIAQKKSLSTAVRSRYEKAQQDSAAIVAKNREQMDKIRKEIARIDQTIMSVSNDLSALSERNSETGATGADDRTIAKLQAQGMQYDSLIRARQSDLSTISTRRSKLRQDSLDNETRLLNDRNRFRRLMYPFDSLALLSDAAIRQAEQKIAGNQAEKDRKITLARENQSLMARQKKDYDQRIAKNNIDVQAFSVERQKLAQSMGSAQQRYEQLRAPYEKALNEATNDIQRFTRDKPLLKTLRQKLRLDSTISWTRDALDKAIQLAAENKRSAKKLVDQRSTELDSLEAVRDMLTRGTPGLRQVEAQIRGATVFQKTVFTDSALANIDKKTAIAASRLDKARRELEDFDRKNPPVRNSAAGRISQLDTMIAQEKKESIQLIDRIDSLNMVLQDVQNTINDLSAPAQAGSPEINQLIRDKKAEKASFAQKRAKVQQDSAQNEIAGANALTRIKNEVTSLMTQWSRLQTEIDRITGEQDKSRQSLASILDKNRLAKTAAQAEKRKNDSLTSAKQQELSNLSSQSDKLRQDSIALVKILDKMIKGLTPSPASLQGSLSDYAKEINGLQAQSDSLKQLSLAGQGRTNGESRRISQQIASVSKSIEDMENDIARLNDLKKAALSSLESDKRFYDSIITTANHECDGLASEREKVRQDSIASENYINKALQKLSVLLKEHENTIAIRQKSVTDATAELTRARDDSIKIAENIASPPQTGTQPIKNIDSVMEVKAQELTNLQTRHDKAVLDSVKEGEHCAALLSAAHNEIVKKGIALEQRKNELSLSNAVKGDGKYMDPLERSYREALAASNLEIQTKNDVIKKKKNDIARLRTVRDALSGATDESGDGNTRVDRDKLYYDSLLSIAGQELSAIIAMRDIARQDSASAEAGLIQSTRKTVPVPERGVSSIQKDVTNATSEYQRALDDSVKIVNAIPNTLQPYAQSIRTIDALITVKGKELANLQNLLDQTSKDGSKTGKHNAELLAAAHGEIVKQSGILDKTKNDLAQAMAAKNDAQNDADPSVRNYKQTLDAAKLQLNVQNEQIASKKDEITRLQKVRDAINTRIKNPTPVAPPAGETRTVSLSPHESVQKLSESLYVLIGENRVDDAADSFSKNQAFLKANLDQESFTALKMTITEMGGKIK